MLNYAPDVTIVERLDIAVQDNNNADDNVDRPIVDSSSFFGMSKMVKAKNHDNGTGSNRLGSSTSTSSPPLFSEENTVVSSLSIEGVRGRHSGNYTCDPSNARPVSVLVHVVDGEST